MERVMFTLVEIHDTDDDHEVGGQDLPYLVTAKYDGDYRSAADAIHQHKELAAFNVQPAVERTTSPGHIEFCTFESTSTIYKFFGVAEPLSTEEKLSKQFWQSTYARTVGELRAALEGYPDDFPLIHTGYDDNLASKNRLGVHVKTNTWIWTTSEQPNYGHHGGWAMPISNFDTSEWNEIVAGSWKNKKYDDIQ